MGVPNFSSNAAQVLALARKEAKRLNHNYVGSEHLLFGLIRLGRGGAANVLNKLGFDPGTIGTEMERRLGAGPQTTMVPNIPYTPRFKRVLAYAAREAESLGRSYIGTEHLLLGLLSEGEGTAAEVLISLGINQVAVRNEILNQSA